jgi:ABC-type Fe3+ transport system substrate-binding protein
MKGWSRFGSPAILGTLTMLGSLLAVGCERAGDRVVGNPPPRPKRLTVVTPHNEKIRRTFQHNFSAWHVDQRGTSVDFHWIVRGTPECLAYVAETAAALGRDDPRPAPDLMFGGGIADHVLLAERGHSLAIELRDLLAGIPAAIDGLPTRDEQGRWHATGLSSFGILYNQAACMQRGIAPPASWQDLAEPRFRSWIGLANPSQSGSTRECLLLILQQQGWEQGWATIMRMLANARALVDRSSVALHQVKTGVSLATCAVNFDGMALAAESGGALVYVNPPGQTATNPSAISVLKTSADEQLAIDFVRFCLSEAGQKLWGLRAEQRGGIGATLYHYPIDPRIYADFADQLALQENPLEQRLGVQIDLERRAEDAGILLPLVRAACGENHVRLQQAWRAVVDAGTPATALSELTALPFEEQELVEMGRQYEVAEPAAAAHLLADWSRVFQARYEQVLSTVRPQR